MVFLTIENRDERVKYYPVRRYVYRLVDLDYPGSKTYGRFPYPMSPGLIDKSFYHVSPYNLGERWWRIPTAVEQTLLKTRYGDDLVF